MELERAGPAAGRARLASAIRLVWGLFFVASSLVNLVITFPHPELYREFANLTFLPFYRDLLLDVAVPNGRLITALVIVFELAAGVLVLTKGRAARMGLLATAAWVLFVWPAMGWYTIASPLLLFVPWWLLRNQQD
jgi:hypothetical protein